MTASHSTVKLKNPCAVGVPSSWKLAESQRPQQPLFLKGTGTHTFSLTGPPLAKLWEVLEANTP